MEKGRGCGERGTNDGPPSFSTDVSHLTIGLCGRPAAGRVASSMPTWKDAHCSDSSLDVASSGDDMENIGARSLYPLMKHPSSSTPLRSAKTGREICGKSFGRFGVLLDSLLVAASNELRADFDRLRGGETWEGVGEGCSTALPFPLATPKENRRSALPVVPPV